MNFQNVLDAFFLPEDQDAFAKSQGWEDAAQMVYYENMVMEEQARLGGSQDELLHELAKEDAREVYTDSEDCPRDGDFEMIDWQDLAGVY